MKTSLLKGLNQQDRDEIKGLFIQSLRLRQQLIKTLEEKVKSAETDILTKESYDSPSWAYKQADYIGYKRGITEIISLLTNEEK